MTVIYPHFLKNILAIHDDLHKNVSYPFFDPACLCYEVLRAVQVDGTDKPTVLRHYGLSEYAYQKSREAFQRGGVAGLVGLDSKRLSEDMPLEVERKVVVLKHGRAGIPATKMVMLLQGFDHEVSLSQMRHLYASYGWALGTKPYQDVDFWAVNLKVMRLSQLQRESLLRSSFFQPHDRLQVLLEVFRRMETRGPAPQYPGSRVSFGHHKKQFFSLGLLGLVAKARTPFRHSKLGLAEEGHIILSKIQHPEKNEAYYLKILETKNIRVVPTCLTNIFTRWGVETFQSPWIGDLTRFLRTESEGQADESYEVTLTTRVEEFPQPQPARLDKGCIALLHTLTQQPLSLANPGLFLFLPYLNRLKLFEKASSLMNHTQTIDPAEGYSWFSLLLLNLGRILGGISSISKACRTHELSLPLMAGLVSMPSNDSLLNGLASIDDSTLLKLRQYVTRVAKQSHLIEAKRIALDFTMQDFTGDDVELKNIGKGPSPKRKICFPGFRPHIAWDVDTGTPISVEFRNGKARATTTIKKFVRELLQHALGNHGVEHVYLDSEYTAEYVWQFIVDPLDGLGADLTMCIKHNKRVKKFLDAFLQTEPTWIFFDEHHTHSQQTFEIPIRHTQKILQCVLKRKESTGKLRCFGSTLPGLDSQGILKEYRARWTVENGIKDLVANYYLDNIPGIDPHRINIHYFVVSLARILYEMFCRDYPESRNPDNSKKMIDTLRPEFLIGSNATLRRAKNELIMTWKDYYPDKQHHALTTLFNTLNNQMQQGLPFLGGLKLRFEIGPPRPEELRNQFKRDSVEF